MAGWRSTTSCHQRSRPCVQSTSPAGAADHHHLAHLGALQEGLVHVGLERRGGPAAVAAVGGDHHPGVGVEDAAGERLGGEPAEDHRVRRPQPGAGQHGHHGLGDHRHVDGDPVAGDHAQLHQGVGRPAHHRLQVGVGDGAGVALGLTHPVEGHLVPPTGLDVPVDAVVRGVEAAADEPLAIGEIPLEHRLPVVVPGEAFGLLRPPGGRIGGGGLVDARLGIGLSGQLRRGLEAPGLVQQGGQRLSAVGCRCVAHACPLPAMASVRTVRSGTVAQT